MKKVIIIGGGISGLSSGIHAQLKGFESIVIEKHLIPGGNVQVGIEKVII